MSDFSLHNQNTPIEFEKIELEILQNSQRTLFAGLVFNRLKIASISALVGSSIVRCLLTLILSNSIYLKEKCRSK